MGRQSSWAGYWCPTPFRELADRDPNPGTTEAFSELVLEVMTANYMLALSFWIVLL